MRSGDTDDLEERNYEAKVVIYEVEGWRCLDPV